MSDRKVNVRYSKDGGYNFGHWKERSLGELGEFQDRTRVVFRRCGQARQFQFEVEVSSPIKATLIAAYGDIEQLAN
jgi:hypothetical protein